MSNDEGTPATNTSTNASPPSAAQSASGSGSPTPAVPPELDALTAAIDSARNEGTTAATKALLTELGFDDAKAATEQLRRWREADDAKKDELTKAQEAAAAAVAERDEARRDRAAVLHSARVERALLAKGAQPGQVARLVRLVDVNPDGTDEQVAQAIDALAVEFPAGFATTAAPSGVSGANPPATQATGDAMKAGEERYKREQERAPKFSLIGGRDAS